MKRLFTLLLLCACNTLSAQTLDEKFPLTGGDVYAITKDNATNTLYVGGKFDWAGPNTQHLAFVDPITGLADPTFPQANGTVYCAVSDNNGGWYIGGDFTMVGGLPRKYIAKIDANNSVSAWNVLVDGPVRDIEQDFYALYFAGDFTTVNNLPRRNIAAVDAVGALLPWNPNPNGHIHSLFAYRVGSTFSFFVTGDFDKIGGKTREKIAQLDASNGDATSFAVTTDPNADLRTVAVVNDMAFIGGDFTDIGGLPRKNMAAVNINTGIVDTFNPGPNGVVKIMAADNVDQVYFGGDFTTFYGKPRMGAARVGVYSWMGIVLANWNPQPDVPGANQIFPGLFNGPVFIGGKFSKVNGHLRNNIAAVDNSSASLDQWDPGASGELFAIAQGYGGPILLGGNFESAGGVKTRRNAFAMNCGTGEITDWDPAPDGDVLTLAVSGNTIYAGGEFRNIGGQPRNFLAALDDTTGKATSFDAKLSTANPAWGNIRAIVPYKGTIFAGGFFDYVNGSYKPNIVQLDSVSAASLPFIYSPDYITSLKLNNEKLYIGKGVNNTASILSVFDIATGSPYTWQGQGNGWGDVNAMSFTSKSIYVGGLFNTIGSKPRWLAAELSLDSGLATSWAPSVTKDPGLHEHVYAIVQDSTNIYMGGSFVTPVPFYDYLISVTPGTGTINQWNTQLPVGSSIRALEVDSQRLYVGGAFSSISGAYRKGLAAYKLPVYTRVKEYKQREVLPLALYPNPTSDGQFTCTFSSTKTETQELTITDITGRVLHTQKVNVVNGKNTINVSVAHLSGNQLLMVNIEGVGVGKLMVK